MRKTALVLLLCLAGATAFAQEQRGSIEGVIKDSTGAIIPGVTVEARSPSLVGVQTALTDASGVYRFPALAPGKYEITATLQGFSGAKATGVALELGQILKVDLTMSVSGIAETVQVRGESPLIDVKQNAAATSIVSDVIDRIPKGRDFTNLVAFQAPGANQESRAGGIQIDGASGSENRYVIDGMDSTDLRSGTSRTGLLTDFVQEVQVKSSGYNAEYRASTGGVISAITKSGGNSFHGTVGTYWTSDGLQGSQRKSLRLGLTNQDIAEQFNTPDDNFTRTEPVADLGGPLLHDRVWFYAGYIPQLEHRDRTVTFVSNNVTQKFTQYTRDHNVNYNLTTQALKDLRVRFAGSNQRNFGAPAFPAIEPDGTSRSTYANFQGDRVATNGFNDFYSGVVDWVASYKLYVNVTTGYLKYGTHEEGPVGTKLRHQFSASNLCAPNATPGSGACPFPEIPASLQQANMYVDEISSSKNYRDDYGRITFNTDATYYANWAGQHTFKAGVQYERLSNDVNRGAALPTMNLFWNASRSTLSGTSVRGKYGYYTVTRNVFTLGDIAFSNTGLFFQDAWTVNKNLTLNLGLRTEREDIPSYQEQNPGVHFGLKDKISPRIGFAYDVTGNSDWKVYGSWGVFYDLMKLSLSRILFGADRWVDYFYTLDTFDWPSIQCSYPPVSGPGCPGTFIEQADFRHVANDADASLVDPGLKPMKTQEFTLGADHELTQTMSVGVRYSHKWLNRTIEAFGVLVPNVGEIYRIANPGYGWDESPLTDPFISPGLQCGNCPGQPPAKRIYDGVEFRLRKRFADRWEMTSSYTVSRLFGNYAGLANSDESANGNGRTDPNSSRNFDQLTMYYDHNGQVVEGRLQTDRPQVLKFEGSYDFKWGTTVGANYILQSGTPLQTQMNHLSGIFFFPFGRGDLGRTPTFSQTDLLVQHTFGLGKYRLNVNANVLNLFDQDIVTGVFTQPYRDNINLSFVDFFNGFDPAAYARANNVRNDARFLLPSLYQSRRAIRLNAKITF
jgi:outer membrane receptor protein involved in Fe transport